MPQLLPLMRQRYPQIAKDLIAPLLDVLATGRAACGGDLDKLLIVLVVAMRTFEHKGVETMDLADVLSGAVKSMPSLSTNVRSIAESTGIPKETVRRKVGALVAEGWIRREANSLSLAPLASQMLTEARELLLLMALRNHQTILALEQTQER